MDRDAPRTACPTREIQAGSDVLLSRRRSFGIGAGLAMLAALPSAARAQPASTAAGEWGQTPGVIRWKIGDIEVTAVSDGFSTLPLDVVPKADPVEAKELAKAAFLPPGDALPISVNTYVVRSAGHLAVIDTGAGRLLGPHAGIFLESLKAADVSPEAVDTVIITHLHPDHVSGMTTADGRANFPNARLVVHENELTYWDDDANAGKVPAVQKSWFKVARDAIAPYRKRIDPITRNGQVILPGVAAEELFGHTPGHTGLRITAGSDQLLIWADIVHLPHLQFPEPAWGMSFDVDADRFVATRRRAFDMAASDRLLVAGMHLNFPGFGHVAAAGPTGYAFVPASWRFIP